jgi:hypothetical protein
MSTVHNGDIKKGNLFINSNSSQIKRIDIGTDHTPVYIDSKHLVATLGDLQIHREDLRTLLFGERIIYQLKGNGTAYLGSSPRKGRIPFLIRIPLMLFDKILPLALICQLYYYNPDNRYFLLRKNDYFFEESDGRNCHRICGAFAIEKRAVQSTSTKSIECRCTIPRVVSLFYSLFSPQ